MPYAFWQVKIIISGVEVVQLFLGRWALMTEAGAVADSGDCSSQYSTTRVVGQRWHGDQSVKSRTCPFQILTMKQ